MWENLGRTIYGRRGLGVITPAITAALFFSLISGCGGGSNPGPFQDDSA